MDSDKPVICGGAPIAVLKVFQRGYNQEAVKPGCPAGWSTGTVRVSSGLPEEMGPRGCPQDGSGRRAHFSSARRLSL